MKPPAKSWRRPASGLAASVFMRCWAACMPRRAAVMTHVLQSPRAELGMDCKRACEGYASCLQCIVLHAAAFCCSE